ncbi:MAG: hypothetical protein JWQ18_2594, partial [Conexibacter sp.]|nr:hypothetical protein [Conexibacter sp.]
MQTLAARPVPTALPRAGEVLARHGAFGRRWLEAMWDGDPL